MQRIETRLSGPVLIEPTIHRDDRGFFLESYRREVFEQMGIPGEFVQINHSRSSRGVLRGMHYQRGMGKLVRCPRGAILDVLLDIRRGSPTYGEWESFELNDDNLHELFAPEGFAHGFCVLSDEADVTYACSSYYDPDLEGAIAYDDPDLGIEWPSDLDLLPSSRDSSAARLKDVVDELGFEYELPR